MTIDQVQNGILHVMVAALFEVQNYFFLVKFLCFLLISEMFNEPYLLHFPGDLSLILWQQVSHVEADQFVTDGHFWKHERKTAY